MLAVKMGRQRTPTRDYSNSGWRRKFVFTVQEWRL
jgi:hypothetical protein